MVGARRLVLCRFLNPMLTLGLTGERIVLPAGVRIFNIFHPLDPIVRTFCGQRG